jgi:hypothetical protein
MILVSGVLFNCFKPGNAGARQRREFSTEGTWSGFLMNFQADFQRRIHHNVAAGNFLMN